MIHEQGNPQVELTDEVARDGVSKNEIKPSSIARKVMLGPLVALKDVHVPMNNYPPQPVFRRISAHRIELWTDQEGWLFDDRGRILAHVRVPRRDGKGRDWFGAFLPNGMWITTDLWESDRQLNCYSSKAVWQWELQGDTILDQLPKPRPNAVQNDEPVYPSLAGRVRIEPEGDGWFAWEMDSRGPLP